jgi:hypothetical protein
MNGLSNSMSPTFSIPFHSLSLQTSPLRSLRANARRAKQTGQSAAIRRHRRSGVGLSRLDFLLSWTRSLECGSNVLADLRSEKRRGRSRNSFLTTARTTSVQKFKVQSFKPTLMPVPNVPIVQPLRSRTTAARPRRSTATLRSSRSSRSKRSITAFRSTRYTGEGRFQLFHRFAQFQSFQWFQWFWFQDRFNAK